LLPLADRIGVRPPLSALISLDSPVTLRAVADKLQVLVNLSNLKAAATTRESSMNAVEQSLVESINSLSNSLCNYKEKQCLKKGDVKQRMSIVLAKLRRREQQARWGIGVLCLTMLMELFLDVFTQQRSIWLVVVYGSLFFNSALIIRHVSMTLAKLETHADLWLRQNQSTLAEFDAANANAKAGMQLE
jgi:hypothetical protein